jgi:hypothetical protein
VVRVDSNLWEAAWHEATAEQREALKDGELSFAEYEAAAAQTVQCMEDAGLEGEAKLDQQSRSYAIGARWQSSGDRAADKEKETASDNCYAQFWNGVSQAWAAENQPTESVLNAARQALAQCLRDAGLDVPVAASSEDIAAVSHEASFAPCSQETSQEYGIPNFGG